MPEFDSAVTEYTAETPNATNKVTATLTDETAELEILVGDTEIQNEGTASWAEGENTMTITVSGNGSDPTVYTVTVTRTVENDDT